MPICSIDGLAPTLPADGEFWLAPGATIIGDVYVGRAVGIWFGAVLRADNDRITVGIGSNIQDNCVLHADPGFPLSIGDYCTIGHNATVHGCTVGDNTLIGMGSTILNGARIGRNCLVAASALVTENTVIPDNCMVRGVPGKVVGELDEVRIRSIRASADAYIAMWQRYRSRLITLGDSS
jgi:carbonic anhydrase/acetyltransferase-like protein (isoleucine patch superfamily)